MSQCATASAASVANSHQLDLFPHHHAANQAEETKNHEHENVAYFFSAADGGANTLTGLIDTATDFDPSHITNDSSRPDDLSPSAATLTYAYRTDGEEGAALVRNALRSREMDYSSEEKWVCYSEVVERKMKEEEVTSSAVHQWPADDDRAGIQRLSLKLDYKEILNAWSDRGPLYVHEDSPQVVPDISEDFLAHEDVSGGCNNVKWWAVPEIEKYAEMRLENKEELKTGQREASVLRYKAKRQHRLFSKQIRYQVRKLNADKRPRLKGRFVKRN